MSSYTVTNNMYLRNLYKSTDSSLAEGVRTAKKPRSRSSSSLIQQLSRRASAAWRTRTTVILTKRMKRSRRRISIKK